ncbi:MAG: cobalamin-dependent protein, partial [Chloroflexota bacterium]|nr:cobalamin-dependent protein [Chloroflexota bacterium]
VPGIHTVGEDFRCGAMFLPDMMAAAQAMQEAIGVLEPEMLARSSKREVLGRVVIGTVQGDIHEIGKNLVGMMLTANGFEVHDLGVNVSPDQFVAKVREVDATIVGVSALLTTTMVGQRTVIQTLADAGLRDGVKVIVGGAPVTRTWADEIGADGYGEDAVSAVNVTMGLVGT